MVRVLRMDYGGETYEVYYCKNKEMTPYVIYKVEAGNRDLVGEYRYFATCIGYILNFANELSE